MIDEFVLVTMATIFIILLAVLILASVKTVYLKLKGAFKK